MGHLLAIAVSIAYLSVSVLVFIENRHAISVYAVLVGETDLGGVAAGCSIETDNFSIIAGVAIIRELQSLKLGSNSTSRRTNVWIAFLFILSLALHLPHNLFQFLIHTKRFFGLFLLLDALPILASKFLGTLKLVACLIPCSPISPPICKR